MTPDILRRTLGDPSAPYRNSYDGDDVQADVEAGDMILHESTYRITMQGIVKYGIPMPKLADLFAEGYEPCPECNGKGVHHEIIDAGEHSYPTFQLLDCDACEGTGEVDL